MTHQAFFHASQQTWMIRDPDTLLHGFEGEQRNKGGQLRTLFVLQLLHAHKAGTHTPYLQPLRQLLSPRLKFPHFKT